MARREQSTIISIFPDQCQAERAVQSLRAAGIPDESIGMVRPDEPDAITGMKSQLVGLGVPEQQANFYQRELEGGRTLVAVHADERTDIWHSILKRYGSTDSTNWSSEASPSPNVWSPKDERLDRYAPDGQSIQLHEERLVGETTRHDAGEVIIRRMVEEIPIRREVERDIDIVDVQHVPVGQVVSERRSPWHEGDTVVVPIYEERLVVERQLVLTENLRIRRVSRTEREQVHGTILRERAVIDDPGHFVREQDSDAEHQSDSSVADRGRGEGL